MMKIINRRYIKEAYITTILVLQVKVCMTNHRIYEEQEVLINQ
jgi:hypothetical protein